MKTQTWLSVAILLTAFALGCVGNDGSAGPALTELPPLLAADICDAFLRCLGPATPKSLSREVCIATNTAAIEDGDFQYLQGAIDAGRVTYNGGRAQTCLNDLSAADCADIGGGHLPASCDTAITGTVALGNDCALREECAGDTFCKMNAMCPGTCTALLTAGGTCNQDDDCAQGLVCGAAGTCTTNATEGMTCGGSAADCSLGLICAGENKDQNISGMCVTAADAFVGDLGDACSYDTGTYCKEGLSCVATITGTGTSTMVNWKCEAELAADADCKVAIPDQCPASQYCDANPSATVPRFRGTCTDLPRAGQDCSEWQNLCDNGSVCDSAGLCQPINRIGGACSDDTECASENCNGTTCVAPKFCTL
jgi:hypothetical protein